MKKLLKSQKGSSFVYVLVIIMILSILTGSLITATVANYKIGLTKGGRNTAFYFADGAIEEALAEIEELNHRAEVAASNVIQDEEADFKTEDKWIRFEQWLERKQLLAEDAEGFLTAEDAGLLYSDALNKEFEKQYYLNLLEDGEVDEDYTLIDEDEDAFVTENNITFTYDAPIKTEYLTNLKTVSFRPQSKKEFEDVKAIELGVEASFTADKEIQLKLTSNGAYNIYDKSLEVVVNMVPVKYDFSTVSSLERKQLYTNDLLENALTAGGDIIVVGGKVTVDGDTYARGTYPDGFDIKHEDKGGIVVGYDEASDDFLDVENQLNLDESLNATGSLEVKGNLKTASSVKFANSSTSVQSILNVTKDLYADSFVINKGIEGTSTSVKRNMFLMDDLFVNGSNASIVIGDEIDGDDELLDGMFVSFLDGLDVDNNGAKVNPDLSAAIRINKKAKGTKITMDNLYVPGLAYIDVYQKNLPDGEYKYYKTGESVTAENNFFFYQERPAEQELRTDEFVYTDGEKDYSLIEYVDEEGNIVDSPEYKVEHFLNRVYREYEIEDGNKNIVSLEDKEILTIRSIKNQEPDDLSADATAYTDNYALGVFIGNGRIYNPRKLDMGSGKFISDVKHPYNYLADLQMNYLGMRDYKTGKLINTIDKNDDTSTSLLDTFIDFSKDDAFTDVNRSGQLLVLNKVASKDIYINVPSSHIPSGADAIIYQGVNTISGVVATKGNIYIYNNGSDRLTFNGALIADGSIVFYGNGEKTIDNYDSSLSVSVDMTSATNPHPISSKAIVYGTVGSNTTLVNAFHLIDTEEGDKGGRKLVVERTTDTASKIEFSRSALFNLDLDVKDRTYGYATVSDDSINEPGVGMVDISMTSNPQLDGASKDAEIKGYELVYWREI